MKPRKKYPKKRAKADRFDWMVSRPKQRVRHRLVRMAGMLLSWHNLWDGPYLEPELCFTVGRAQITGARIPRSLLIYRNSDVTIHAYCEHVAQRVAAQS